MASPSDQQPDTRRRLTILIVTAGAFMAALDSTIVNIAIPELQGAFGVDVTAVQWIVTAYLLALGAVTPVSAFLANRVGIWRSYLVVLVVFTAGSALCALAPDFGLLVAFRVVLAIGGGPLLTLGMTYVLRAFPPEKRTTAIATVQVPALFAPMLGPVVGGFLISVASWRYVFLINIPIGLFAFVIGVLFLPEHRVERDRRFDAVGFGTVAPGFVALLFGLSQGSRIGWGSAPVLAALAAGVTLLVFFVWWELRTARGGREPLIDLRIFRLRSFWAGLAAIGLLSCILFWPNFIMPIYLQSLRALSAAHAGLLMGILAAGSIAFALIGGRIADKIGTRAVSLIGVSALAVVTWLFSRVTLTTPLWQVGVLLGARGMCSGLTLQPLLAAAMVDVRKPADVAHASTLATLLRNVTGAVGTGLLVSLAQMWAGTYIGAASAGAQATGRLRAQAQMAGIRGTFLLSVAIVAAAIAFSFLLKKKEAATTPEAALRLSVPDET